jgi:DNA repair exonuclease SbcCD ATPase subunit
MLSTGFLEMVFVVQLVLVSLVFMRALRRTRSPRMHSQTRGVPPLPRNIETGEPSTALRRAGADRSSATQGALLQHELDELEAQRASLLDELAAIRSEQVAEESAFRARSREVLLQLHEHQRANNELATREAELEHRVAALRTEVDHLDRRRPEFAAEIRASTRVSTILRERIVLARRELDELQQDRDRVRERLNADTRRLNDLSRRRALLQAETEELALLARTLQRSIGGSPLLSQLTDSEPCSCTTQKARTLVAAARRPVAAINGRHAEADWG